MTVTLLVGDMAEQQVKVVLLFQIIPLGYVAKERGGGLRFDSNFPFLKHVINDFRMAAQHTLKHQQMQHTFEVLNMFRYYKYIYLFTR